MTEVWTLEPWLGANGYVTTADIDGHIHAGLRCKPNTKTFDRFYFGKLKELQANRSKGVEAYTKALENGEIREPTRIERLRATAKGHPDNASVQAARNILKKQGIDYET